MKNLLLVACALALVMVPACRKKKKVVYEDTTVVTKTHVIERVSGPDGWQLTEEDLK